MVDRPDIDALLIGALYSELTPAEQARLSAHLESHPGDRALLNDLESARRAVRQSRILDTQLEPPQAVSAMLLQEAARRAPKHVRNEDGQESWLFRFAHSFMRHPAMAAAAMLVLVVGVAGTMYMKKGDSFAEKTVASSPASPAARSAEPGVADRKEALPEGGSRDPSQQGILDTETANTPANAADRSKDEGARDDLAARDKVGAPGAGGYQVDLAGKTDRYRAQTPADPATTATAPSASHPEAVRGAERQEHSAAPVHDSSKLKAAKKPYIEVQTKAPSPKDLVAQDGFAQGAKAAPEREADGTIDTDTRRAGGIGTATTATVTNSSPPHGGAGTGTGHAAPALSTDTRAQPSPTQAMPQAPKEAKPQSPPPSRVAPTAPPRTAGPAPAAQPPGRASAPPPPAPAPAQIASDRPAAKKTGPGGNDDAPKPADKPVDSMFAWAKREHAHAIAVARNGNCADAAKIAVNVQNRAPDYYAQNMATDRALKQCQQYITDARDKDAEQSAKVRASKRVNTEAPSTAK